MTRRGGRINRLEFQASPSRVQIVHLQNDQQIPVDSTLVKCYISMDMIMINNKILKGIRNA